VEFIASDFRAVLVCVDPQKLAPSFAGRMFDHALLRDLLYSVLMFGGFALAQARVPALRPVPDVK
jgi:hypothetical protein